MGKKDSIYTKENSSDLPFSFNQEVAEVFEDMIVRSVPGYTSSLTLVKNLTIRFFKENSNCYDLGCSLGAATESLIKATEGIQTKIISVDSSRAMIDLCKHNFTEYIESGKIQFINQDILDCEIKNASIVIINFVLQFLNLEERTNLLKIIYEGLVPEGKVVLSEKIHFENEFRTKTISNLHHKFKAANGYTKMEISRKRDSLEGVLITDSEIEHLKRLESIGFKKIKKVMSNLNFITLVAEK